MKLKLGSYGSRTREGDKTDQKNTAKTALIDQISDWSDICFVLQCSRRLFSSRHCGLPLFLFSYHRDALLISGIAMIARDCIGLQSLSHVFELIYRTYTYRTMVHKYNKWSQWNDFKGNATSTFGILRKGYDFSDVTLAWDFEMWAGQYPDYMPIWKSKLQGHTISGVAMDIRIWLFVSWSYCKDKG